MPVLTGIACLLAGLFSTTDGGPAWKQAAVLYDDSPYAHASVAQHIADLLNAEGIGVEKVSYGQLTAPGMLTSSRFDCLVLPYSPAFPLDAWPALDAFLRQGGDLVLLGGHAFSQPLKQIDGAWQSRTIFDSPLKHIEETRTIPFYGAFEEYEIYHMPDIRAIRTYAGQSLFTSPISLSGNYSGVSAVGFTFPGQAWNMPLLTAYDASGRRCGLAASLLINYGGDYLDSRWLLFGVEGDGFYLSSEFDTAFRACLEPAQRDGLETGCASQYREKTELKVEITTPAPPRILLNKEHKRFEYEDGRPFFMIGANYTGNVYIKYDAQDIQEVEKDFQMMHQYGINFIRIWGPDRFLESPGRELLIEMCRRYGVYFMPVVTGSQREQEKGALQERATKMALAFKDEPVLLAFDLKNEPYFWEMAAEWTDAASHIKMGDGKPACPPNELGWAPYLSWAGIFSHPFCSSLPGLRGPLPYPTEPNQQNAFEYANQIYADMIHWAGDPIRAALPGVPLTVGYNTVWDCLPANQTLDFVSHHCYTWPDNFECVILQLSTMDSLHACWPDRPISLGEFGYPNSYYERPNAFLDVHASALGELLHYLYAFAKGYGGCAKWMLNDISVRNAHTQMTWLPWDNQQEVLKESRLGIFYDDGTPEHGVKPLAYGLRFLSEFIAAGNEGGWIWVDRADTPIETGYVYRHENALFIGNMAYESPSFAFTSPDAANVMLRWDGGVLRLMSTADTSVRIQPRAYLPNAPANAPVQGKYASMKYEGDMLLLSLLEGETISIEP